MSARVIEIDLDIHKLIEVERKSFDESVSEILRRLLGREPAAPPSAPQSIGSPWMGKGVALSDGTRVRFCYGRGSQTYEGRIENGKWAIASRTFNTPSAAASELAQTRNGQKTNLNGWLYFQAFVGGRWEPLDVLKRRAAG
jgi:hypothetical protein